MNYRKLVFLPPRKELHKLEEQTPLPLPPPPRHLLLDHWVAAPLFSVSRVWGRWDLSGDQSRMQGDLGPLS